MNDFLNCASLTENFYKNYCIISKCATLTEIFFTNFTKIKTHEIVLRREKGLSLKKPDGAYTI